MCTLGTDRQIDGQTDRNVSATSEHPPTVAVRLPLAPSSKLVRQLNTAFLHSTCPAVAATRLSVSLHPASHLITLPMSQLSLTFGLLLTVGAFTMRSSAILSSQFPLVRSFVSHKHASSVVIFLCHREGKLSPVTLHAEKFVQNPEVPYDVKIFVSHREPTRNVGVMRAKHVILNAIKETDLKARSWGTCLCIWEASM